MEKFMALVLSMLAFTATADEIDKRQVLSLTEHQRDHVLTEMRAMLSGTQKILDALSREDMQAVATEARSLGMGMTDKAEGHLKSVLPKDLMQLGMSVHKAFDKIAEDAESLKDPKHTLRQLVDSMQKCTACHASYQIRVKTHAKGQSPAPDGQHLHHQH
ncbi:MAG TPA: hypothetical protein VFI43_03885 [Nitrosospira sp.]|nr:hypothetical protein [Nitrosospira sp.]